jgi:hypothetical protein
MIIVDDNETFLGLAEVNDLFEVNEGRLTSSFKISKTNRAA